jgi:hypothetical protein
LAGLTQSQDVTVLVHQGTTICLLSSKDEAAKQGIPQRIAIVEVTSIGADRSVTLTISTYRVPS